VNLPTERLVLAFGCGIAAVAYLYWTVEAVRHGVGWSSIASLRAGVVLAAGASRRMGRRKALLRNGRQTFLDSLCAALGAGGCNPVLAVVAEPILEIEQCCRLEGVQMVLNPDPSRGQISSLRCAITRLSADVKGGDGTLFCRTHFDPFWRLLRLEDGKQIEVSSVGECGQISAVLPPGKGTFRLFRVFSPRRVIGWLLGVLAALILAILSRPQRI